MAAAPAVAFERTLLSYDRSCAEIVAQTDILRSRMPTTPAPGGSDRR